MRDGHYLSTYLNPVGLHRLAQVRLRHSNNLSLWRKQGSEVTLVAHWELERVSGQKMHRTPFLERRDETAFIDSLLAPHGLALADMVEVWGTPHLATRDDYHLAEQLPQIAFHSVAHLYGAALMDSEAFFEGTVVGLAVDRGPDRMLDRRPKDRWFAGCVVRRGDVEIFPVESPGPLYCEARDRFLLREGSLMALATASAAHGESDRERLLAERRFDGTDVVERSRELLDAICRDVRATLVLDPAFGDEESYISAVMKEVQAASVQLMERNVERILERHGVDPREAHLALAGGYALNCPTNSHLMTKYGFRGLLAPPGVGDDGQAAGIGLAAFHRRIGGPFHFVYPGPYLGPRDDDVEAALAQFAPFVAGVEPLELERVVDDLVAGPVVWLDGASEVGPRALGHRSILADPRSVAAKDAINDMKQRQWWRPVAPIMLEERLNEWFEDARPSPYMLETFTLRRERRAQVPAIAHRDHSARVQTLRREQEPRLHALIEAFERRAGVPMLCNTSLNDKGEPIVDSCAQALNFALRKRVPVAYLNGRRVALRAFERYDVDGPLPRRREPFAPAPQREAALRRSANPHGLSDLHLHLYLSDLELCEQHDIADGAGARHVRKLLDARLAHDPSLRASAERTMRKNEVHFAAFGWEPLVPDRPTEQSPPPPLVSAAPPSRT